MKKNAENGNIASSVKVGERGQIVIPKEMREMFDIQSGDVLLVLADPQRGIAIPPKSLCESIKNNIFGTDPDNNKQKKADGR